MVSEVVVWIEDSLCFGFRASGIVMYIVVDRGLGLLILSLGSPHRKLNDHDIDGGSDARMNDLSP